MQKQWNLVRLCQRDERYRIYLDDKVNATASPWSTVDQVAGFATDTYKHIRNGFRCAIPEVVEYRKSLCRQCPNWRGTFDDDQPFCNICGCHGVKVDYAEVQCPLPIPKWRQQEVILWNHQSPGDIVVMTGVVRELHRSYPGQFVTSVDTPIPELWHNNPLISKDGRGVRIKVTYDGIHQSNQSGKHFAEAMADDLADKLGLRKLHMRELHGDMHLTEWEKSNRPFDEPYWLVNSGVKSDYTCKAWPHYAEVVTQLDGKVNFAQVGELTSDCAEIRHFHQPIDSAFNLLGKTNHRELMHLVYHADGVLCGVTYLMHIAAAFRKPCIAIVGGREPVTWLEYDYPGFCLMDTFGKLPCCENGGCWKSRVVPLGDGDTKDSDLCLRPIEGFPECMRLITSTQVIALITKMAEQHSCIRDRLAI